MKTRLLILGLSTALFAQPLLPDLDEGLSSPGLDRMRGYTSSRWSRLRSRKTPLPPDHPDVRLVQGVVARLSQAVACDHPRLRLSVEVLLDPEPLALCYDGGFIQTSTGLLSSLRRNQPNIEAILAMILGHEIAHAGLQHAWRERVETEALRQAIDVPELSRTISLKLSQAQESEADRYGLLYAVRAGYAVVPSIDFFLEPAPLRSELWTEGTHPRNQERIQHIRRYLQALRQELTLWDEALRAVRAGREDQARIALEILAAEFSNLGPVHNNLGWVYYRLFEKQAHPGFEVNPEYCTELGLALEPALAPPTGGEARRQPEPAQDDPKRLLDLAEIEFELALQCSPGLAAAQTGQVSCARARRSPQP